MRDKGVEGAVLPLIVATALSKLIVPKFASGTMPPLYGASTTHSALWRGPLAAWVVLNDLPCQVRDREGELAVPT